MYLWSFRAMSCDCLDTSASRFSSVHEAIWSHTKCGTICRNIDKGHSLAARVSGVAFVWLLNASGSSSTSLKSHLVHWILVKSISTSTGSSITSLLKGLVGSLSAACESKPRRAPAIASSIVMAPL